MLKLLFLLFVGLKLADVISWSWWYVSIPLIIEAIRYLSRVVLITAAKEGYPWAVKTVKWLRK